MPGSSFREVARIVLVRAAFLGVLAGALLGLVYARRAQPWTRALPESERQALYQRTTENLRTLCRASESEQRAAFCRAQTTLALSLPECDTQCRTLGERWRYTPRPPR
jgi:hypothetical protein